VQYATTGLIHLVSQTDNAELLEAISKLEPLAKHPKLTILLAQHPKTPKQVLKKFLRSGDRDVMEAMATNSALDSAIIKELSKDEKYATILAQNIDLSEAYFELLEAFSEALALNESLNPEMQKALLALDQESIQASLAKNHSATQETLSFLAKDANERLKEALLQNQNIDKEYLQKAFNEGVMDSAIAKNPALPSDIAQELFEKGDSAVLDALSRNEATPVDILYQLQLDSRFERAVKTNAAFGKHIQSENIGWLI
jgi:Rad3-related DNA helicase